MKSPTTNNERVRTPRKNKKQKGSVYQRTSKKERSSRKRKNSRKERRKQKRTKRKNKNRIYIKRRIEGGAPPASTSQDEQEPAHLVLELQNATKKHDIKENLLKIKLPEELEKMSEEVMKNNLENFITLWQQLEVHTHIIDGKKEYYYKIRSCGNKGLKDYLNHCLEKEWNDSNDLKKGDDRLLPNWDENKIKLFNGDLKKIYIDDEKIFKIPEEFIIQLFKYIGCRSKGRDDGSRAGDESETITYASSGADARWWFDANDLESLSNFQAEEEDTEGHEPTPWVALQDRLLDAQRRLTLLGYIPTLGCLPKEDAYMLKYTVNQKVNKIREHLAPFLTVESEPIRNDTTNISKMLDDFITGWLKEKKYRVDNVNSIKALVKNLKGSELPDENEKIVNINIILEELKHPGTCRWQNEDGINEFINFLNEEKYPWGDKTDDEEKALNEIKGIIRASREKYKEAVLEWGTARTRGDEIFDEKVMATIYKRGYIEEHLLALMKKYTGDGKGETYEIFKGGIYQSTRSTISGDSGDSYAGRVGIIEELIKNEKERVKTILSNSSIYYSTSDSGSSGFKTPREELSPTP